MGHNIRIAFLRAVNVGGTGKLAMSDLVQLCQTAGLAKVKTYIASGNVCYVSPHSAEQDRRLLEAGLLELMGKSTSCFVLDLKQLTSMIEHCPFRDYPGNQHVTVILPHRINAEGLQGVKGQAKELIALGDSCLYIAYPDGMGKSKLLVPAAQVGTARNFNTLKKMQELASSLECAG
ncbi:DUF1697 domain-containing protein [Undibacterium cyanobacteriorum]|uniref:DUF1697 domain-containing protein n=1 Tax=Undibacterium cyanobacteriorum TaxID=3073561 RepID=A0ABY9RJN3_9BURK|nr:DUF1697 domain-containing protein [Undibacterium sp. 20NA77.5]WMW81419.1 DUF1697 domain-containing protein [Undibacterium sp. 20NA77.5]